jgi:FkbM family methyltransferase
MISGLRRLALFFMRHIPRVRGHGRVSHLLNRLFLSLGSPPVVTTKMMLGHKMTLDMRAQTEMWAAFSGSYDDKFINLLGGFTQRDGVILDVGANIGLYTVPLARIAATKHARVIAFEPLSRNLPRLRANIALNECGEFVEIIPIALSDRNGEASIELREDFANGSSTGTAVLVQENSPYTWATQETVQVSRLDDLWPTLGLTRLDVVKADVDGHEAEFFAGARKTFEKFRPVMQIEYSPPHFTWRGINLGELLEKSVPPDYQFFYVEDGRLVPIVNMAALDGVTDVIAMPLHFKAD